jgi:hypothetical protein
MFHKRAPKAYGVVAEFDTPDQLIGAAKQARKAGYKRLEAYSPFPVHGLVDAVGFKDEKVPWIVFMGGLVGASCGYLLQYYTSVIDYPMNVGGKPLNSLPMFFPVTYEMTILFASFGAFLGMLALNKLPQPYHGAFNTPNFERASQDKFFLAIESDDEQFDEVETKKFMDTMADANNVSLVMESPGAEE